MQWGAWAGTGMAVVHNLLPRINKSGLGVLPPSRGLTSLEIVLRRNGSPPAQLVVSPFEWRKLMAGADHIFPVSFLQASSTMMHALDAAGKMSLKG
jgi:hypothetical protein